MFGYLPHRGYPAWGAPACRDLHPTGPEAVLHRWALALSLSTCKAGGSETSIYRVSKEPLGTRTAAPGVPQIPRLTQPVGLRGRGTRPGITSSSSTGETHWWQRTTARDEGVATTPKLSQTHIPSRFQPVPTHSRCLREPQLRARRDTHGPSPALTAPLTAKFVIQLEITGALQPKLRPPFIDKVVNRLLQPLT